ncbi:hypothetical protein QL285_064921 [Trifolium repens]|nr:hypothetical protein QL285_064921 [Trifolium repens]
MLTSFLPLPLGIASSYFAELSGAIKAIEIAFDNHWNNLWLETDSMLVVNAFKNQNNCVAWPLRNRWKNALTKTRQMNFLVTHVFREGNKVADLIANFGLNVSFFTSWHLAPRFIMDCLLHNKLVFENHEVYAGSPPQKHHTRPFSSSFTEFSTGSVIFIMCMMIP